LRDSAVNDVKILCALIEKLLWEFYSSFLDYFLKITAKFKTERIKHLANKLIFQSNNIAGIIWNIFQDKYHETYDKLLETMKDLKDITPADLKLKEIYCLPKEKKPY